MENLQKKIGLNDSQLAEEMLKKKLLSSGRLKAAIDYQASVGGSLVDVLVKLGLVKEDDLRTFLGRLASNEEFIWGEDSAKKPIPPPVAAEKLKVHHKLIQKVPPELVQRYNILFFFPPPGQRAILMASNPIVASMGIKKLQDLLCVEICPVQLTDDEMRHFLPDFKGRDQTPETGDPESKSDDRLNADQGADAAKEAPANEEAATDSDEAEKKESAPQADESAPIHPETTPAPSKEAAKDNGADPKRPAGWEGTPRRRSLRITASDQLDQMGSGNATLDALIRLLVKKKYINPQELRVEVELHKRDGGSVGLTNKNPESQKKAQNTI